MAKDFDLGGKLRAKQGQVGQLSKPAAKDARMEAAAGQMPLPSGVPIPLSKDKLLKREVAILEQAGWKDGDPVPSNIADIIKQVRVEQSNIPLPVSPDTPPLQMPEVKDVSEMPAGWQTAVAESLKLAREQAQTGVDFKDLHPSVQRAIESSAGKANFEIEDDQAATTAEKKASTGSRPERTHCQRCGHDLSVPDEVVVTEMDKQSYIAAWCGGKPFVKSYEVLGGAAVLTFRDLSLTENDMCYEQAAIDRDLGRLAQPTDFWDTVSEYRLALSLIEFKPKNPETGSPFALPETLEDWTANLKAADMLPEAKPIQDSSGRQRRDTVVVTIHKYVTDNILPRESNLKVAWYKHAEFGRLLGKLDTLGVVSENF